MIYLLTANHNESSFSTFTVKLLSGTKRISMGRHEEGCGATNCWYMVHVQLLKVYNRTRSENMYKEPTTSTNPRFPS